MWDARLTSYLILLFLYIGYISLQSAIDDPRRALPFRVCDRISEYQSAVITRAEIVLQEVETRMIDEHVGYIALNGFNWIEKNTGLFGGMATQVRDMMPVIQAIRARGITIVMIEHVMQAVMSLAEQVFVLAEGRIIAMGPPQAIAADATNRGAWHLWALSESAIIRMCRPWVPIEPWK